MHVKNLVPWAGDRWMYEPGEVIELDDDTALARIAAGVAEPVAVPAPSTDKKRTAR